MAIIYTSKGQGIMVSEKDHKTLNSFLWYVGKNGYASNDSMPRKLMHRLIMGYPEQNIDHINGNKLDNRRENLRLCTQSGNTANAGKRINNTSGYKGVSWDKKAKRWSVFCTKNMKQRLFKPFVSWRAVWNVIKVLRSGQLAEGPLVKQFEHEFAKKFDKKNVVALNSGTTALELAYELAGLRPEDEVITPVLTCTATNLPLVRKGVRIVFADTDYDLNINIEDVKKKITKKTKAIVFVHFGGNNRGLAEILKLGRERNITIIEDAAQAVGSGFWGKAEYCAVSLQAIKTLTSGDGGFLICRSKRDYEKAKRLRWFGYDRDKKQKEGDTDLKEAGYKYHMNDISAAIGLGNLKAFDNMMAKRQRLSDFYNQHDDVACHNWLCIQYGKKGEQHHYRNDKYTVFKKFKNKCPVMDEVERSWRLLPFHHGVTVKQAKQFYES